MLLASASFFPSLSMPSLQGDSIKSARATRHALVNTYKWRKGDREERDRE